ncbi:MAG: hypothetical protein ACRDI0_08640 [Actinomycetota bacterium]
MATFEELDGLSTRDLHDRAVSLARRRVDVRFFWNLLEYEPAAEAAAGHVEHAQEDVLSLSGRVHELTEEGENDVAEALRPVYIEYLLEHEK